MPPAAASSPFAAAHEFPTLVRKFEAKPIRAYLTTGTHDMENCAGDWFLLDQEMDKALQFSGYDYSFRIINGGHVAGYYDYFREAMAYLWKDWPEPVKAGPSAPRVRDIILPGEPWQLVAEDRHDARGPACNASGEVFFVDAADNKIHRIDLDGKIEEFLSDAGQANSLSVGPKGQLYAVSSRTGKIMSYDAVGQGQPGGRRPSRSTCPRHAHRRPLRHQQRRQAGRVRAASGSSRTARRPGSTRA